MISAVKGTVFDIKPGEVDILTNGGLVLKVFFPVSYFSTFKIDGEILLFTTLRIREDEIVLYGFVNKRERSVFEKLISISGIGGKTGMSFISAFAIDELINAIDNADIPKLSSIPGIGKKTAQRIILELTGKLGFTDSFPEETVQLKDDLISALVNLGFNPKNVKEIVSKTVDNQAGESFEDLFKLILKRVSKL